MKAVICTGYGPPEVLQLKNVPKPEPRPDEVRVKVCATAVTDSDIFIRGSKIPWQYKIPMRLMIGIRKPRKSIIGLVFAGIVDALGESVNGFKIGDKVYGLTGFSLGAYAEYLCIREKSSKKGAIACMPENISWEEGTAVAYGGLLALQYLEKGNIKKGDKVLIYGASGNSGTLAVQMAKALGAVVTGVCSTKNIDLVKRLGAKTVIDYTKTDSPPENEKYDFVLDSVGPTKSSKLKTNCKRALKSEGKYASIGQGNLLLDEQRLNKIKALVEDGKLKPVMDRTYSLEEIVEAHHYVEKGHKVGGVAVTVAE